MATIRARTKRDGTEVFEAQVRKAGFPTRTETFTTRTAAKAWATTVEAEMIEGRHSRSANAQRRTLGEAIDRFIADEVPKKRDTEMHTTTLTWWKAELGDRKLAQITPDLVNDYRDRLQNRKHRGKGISNSRVNRYVACLRRLFTVARKRWRWIDYNPVSGIDMLPENAARIRCLSDAERTALLAATAKDATLHTFVVIALSTACRAGELQKLEWRDVDLKEGRLLFRKTKNDTPRSAHVSGEPLELLKQPGKVRDIHGGPVFPLTSKGKPYAYHKPFKAAVAAAGITSFRFHDLRHTSATYLARNGATEQQLRAIGGWKSHVVNRYVHLAAEDVKHLFDQLAKKVSK